MPRKSTGSTTTRSKKATASQSVVMPATVGNSQEDVSKSVAVPAIAADQTGANFDEEVRFRAYELYLQRNGSDGDPNSDWFMAEQEVRARHATAGHSA